MYLEIGLEYTIFSLISTHAGISAQFVLSELSYVILSSTHTSVSEVLSVECIFQLLLRQLHNYTFQCHVVSNINNNLLCLLCL